MKKIVAVFVVGLLVVAAVVLIKIRKEELAKLKPPTIYPVVVKTIKPKVSNFYLTLTALGTIESSANVNITTNISGRILFVKPLGSRVRKGEIVVKIDTTSIKAKLNSAKSELRSLYSKLGSAELSLKNAILTHKRTKELMRVKGASIEQYQREENEIANLKSNIASIKSAIKSVKNNIRDLKNMLTYAVLRSPINGVVSRKFLNEGDTAMPGRPILQVSAKKGKYLMVLLPQSIKPKGVIFRNKFYHLFSLNSTFNGLNEYKANVNTPLAAGSRVEISVVVFDGKAIKLPFDAVLNDNGKNLVFIFRNNKAIPKPIHIITTGEEGIATKDLWLTKKQIIIAKPDVFIRLLGGVKVVKE